MAATLERLTAEHADAIVSVFCDSFHDYPVMRFIVGPSDEYGLRLRHLINFFVWRRVQQGGPMFGMFDDGGGSRRIDIWLGAVALVLASNDAARIDARRSDQMEPTRIAPTDMMRQHTRGEGLPVRPRRSTIELRSPSLARPSKLPTAMPHPTSGAASAVSTSLTVNASASTVELPITRPPQWPRNWAGDLL